MHGYTSDYLIANHTLLPLYIPFLPQERTTEIKLDMKIGKSNGIYTKIGLVSGGICKKDGLYYCSECVKEDVSKYAESYFRRLHQVQCVNVCPRHECVLRQYPRSRKDSSQLEFIRLDSNDINLNLESDLVPDVSLKEQTLKLSKSVHYILNNDLSQFNQSLVHEKYKCLLYEKGLVTCKGTIRQSDLYEEFMRFFDPEFLDLIESNVLVDNDYNWLKVITRKPGRVVHPIRHVLLIIFLCGSVEKFFSTNTTDDVSPFGTGPWFCLNPVAAHYNEPVVTKLEVTPDYKTREPVGTFSCVCGFIYSRKGPDVFLEDKFKVGRIKKFGKVWETKIKNYLLERTWGLRELARIMGCDPKTVVKYAEMLGLRKSIKGKMKVEDNARILASNVKDYKEQYKKDILDLIKEYPEYNRTQIRSKLQKQYAWFYRNDYNWLDKHLPGKRSSQVTNIRVDWDQRDKELVDEIKKLHRELISADKPVRITKSLIGKKLGKISYLEKKLNKLPKSEQYLSEITETIDQFRERRVRMVVRKLYLEKGFLNKWEIIRRAGLKPDYSRDLEQQIEILLSEPRELLT